MIREREATSLPGLAMLLVLLVALGVTVYALVTRAVGDSPGVIVSQSVVLMVIVIGLTVIQFRYIERKVHY